MYGLMQMRPSVMVTDTEFTENKLVGLTLKGSSRIILLCLPSSDIPPEGKCYVMMVLKVHRNQYN